MTRDAVQTTLASLASGSTDLRTPLTERTRWARSFTSAAYRLVLGREPEVAAHEHAARVLTDDPEARERIVRSLRESPNALALPPGPELEVGVRDVPGVLREMRSRLHDLKHAGLRTDLYLVEVLAAVDSLVHGLPDVLDAAIARSAERRALDRASLSHPSGSGRSFTSGDVTVVEVGDLLVALAVDDWVLGAVLALRGDPQVAITDFVTAALVPGQVVLDVGAAQDGGVAAVRAALAGATVHVVEASERARELLAGTFRLNEVSVEVHPEVPELTGVDLVRLHAGTDLSGLPDVPVYCASDSAPQAPGRTVRSLPGVPRGWVLSATPA